MDGMIDNTVDGRYEIHVGDHVVFASYVLDGDVLRIQYVEAPAELRGTGQAGKLMQAVMDHARERGWKVIPVCGYAASWIRRNGSFDDILA